MRSTEFIIENEQPEYSFKITGSWKDRVWVTMFETASGGLTEVGEAILDINPKDNTVYFNRIDITSGQGKGKGAKLVSEVLQVVTARGFNSVTSYVNHNNVASQGLFRKLGFNVIESDEWDAQYGDYWKKEL